MMEAEVVSRFSSHTDMADHPERFQWKSVGIQINNYFQQTEKQTKVKSHFYYTVAKLPKNLKLFLLFQQNSYYIKTILYKSCWS